MSGRRLAGLVLVVVAALAVLAGTGGALLSLTTATTPDVPAITTPHAVAVSAPAVAAGVAPGSHHARAPHDRVPEGTPGVSIGRVLLAQLVVAPHEQGPSFDRVRDFGNAWTDTDDNHCDTRNDVLAAWFIDTKTAGCRVIEGQLADPYTGRHLTHPSQADIDHVVSLGDAWRSGAARWSKTERVRFANDPRHLVPTTASVNRSKGDKPAEKWLPPDAVYHCDYALIIIATKHAYHLTVTIDERAALDRALMTC